jgi:methylenetetrahydrofolate reductase (NADPH)
MNEPKPIDVSFEFFPPKTPEAETALWAAIRKLEVFDPSYVSITYGAGGSTQDATLATVTRIAHETKLCPVPHLTCVGKTRQEVDEVVRAIGRAGMRHIVALRGDPPGGALRYEPTPGGYVNGADLVGGIRALGDFEISVAAYPEKHPESFTLEVDLAMLAAKVDNGATAALTQFFFDNSAYFRFVDRARARGIDIPIIPGILPVTNFERVRQFAERCGARLTSAFARRFEGLENAPEERRLVAAAVAAEQVTALRAEGVNSFHFYTLNRADVVFAICRMLGLGGSTHMAAA